jgi:hypothetical protein
MPRRSRVGTRRPAGCHSEPSCRQSITNQIASRFPRLCFELALVLLEWKSCRNESPAPFRQHNSCRRFRRCRLFNAASTSVGHCGHTEVARACERPHLLSGPPQVEVTSSKRNRPGNRRLKALAPTPNSRITHWCHFLRGAGATLSGEKAAPDLAASLGNGFERARNMPALSSLGGTRRSVRLCMILNSFTRDDFRFAAFVYHGM